MTSPKRSPVISVGRVLLRIAVVPFVIWAAAAIWFDGPAARPLALGLALVYGLTSLVLLLRMRPFRKGLGVALLLFGSVLMWWLSLAPSNDRNWQPDVARLPEAHVSGDALLIRNLRNFHYRSDTDFDPHWEERTFDLSLLDGVDLFLVSWGPTAIAHTILSWQFSDGQHLAISIETRKEVGEEYSAITGFFRQFELYYVVADESDLIKVRTDCRDERPLLYRLRTPKDRARELLMQYVARIEGLRQTPVWYNAADKNCTTVTFDNVKPLVGKVPFDWRILLNGHIDEMLLEYGIIGGGDSIEQVRKRADIMAISQATPPGPGYGAAIRVGLPQRPPPPKHGDPGF